MEFAQQRRIDVLARSDEVQCTRSPTLVRDEEFERRGPRLVRAACRQNDAMALEWLAHELPVPTAADASDQLRFDPELGDPYRGVVTTATGLDVEPILDQLPCARTRWPRGPVRRDQVDSGIANAEDAAHAAYATPRAVSSGPFAAE